jgi:hypothetical protein
VGRMYCQHGEGNRTDGCDQGAPAGRLCFLDDSGNPPNHASVSPTPPPQRRPRSAWTAKRPVTPNSSRSRSDRCSEAPPGQHTPVPHVTFAGADAPPLRWFRPAVQVTPHLLKLGRLVSVLSTPRHGTFAGRGKERRTPRGMSCRSPGCSSDRRGSCVGASTRPKPWQRRCQPAPQPDSPQRHHPDSRLQALVRAAHHGLVMIE